jgi:hypothetical protein
MDLKIGMDDYFPPGGSPIPGMKVERGFNEVFNGLDRSGLMDMFSELASSGARLIVSGHSLGSALATLTVPLARAAGISGANILHYNQASPKVGNLAFADYYNSLGVQTFRLVNTYDKVPDLPPGLYVPVGAAATFGADYQNEAQRHNPCCSYSYALFNPTAPYNPKIAVCMDPIGPPV